MVYRTCQQRIRYLVEFKIPSDTKACSDKGVLPCDVENADDAEMDDSTGDGTVTVVGSYLLFKMYCYNL